MSDSADASAAGQELADRIAAIYQYEAASAGGRWLSYISVNDASGAAVPAVEVNPDTTVEAYSVNKIAVATAVLDKVDRGQLRLDQRVDVTDAIVIPGGDGIFSLDGAYPSSVTLGHALAALLTVSDDTAVRLCGLVCPAAELNAILVSKGFPKTQVEPVANPNRFFLGTTTPRDTHNLLRALVGGTLLSAGSTAFLLNTLRSPIAFTDGIRRNMSSADRARIATKAGWFADGRNEAGIIFDAAGAPVLTYAMFADGQADADNFGATHPAVQARADMGPRFLKALAGAPEPRTGSPRRPRPLYHPSNGG
ncbi:serine hydrolase [Micromonospora sp. NPDC049559]|uniref:serine hydrolase n=1 Tax=Micromonospora sp. NPDC049559 TaxID=3155923 RepID=UPI003413EE40